MKDAALMFERPKSKLRRVQRILAIAASCVLLLGAVYKATPVVMTGGMKLWGFASAADVAIERSERIAADSALRADLTRRMDVQLRVITETHKWTWCLYEHISKPACEALQPPVPSGEQ